MPLYILILLVLVSFAGGSGFSLYMNAEFGASRVGELGRWVAVICDLFKIGLSGALLFFHHWFTRFIGLVGITAFATLSIFSSYGYYIKNIDHKAGEHQAVQKRYHTLQNRKQELLQSLGNLGEHRSIKVLEKDITAHKRDRIYTDKRRSNQCSNATIEESRIFCDRLRKLEVALEQARFANPRITIIQGQLSEIQNELNGIDLTLVTRKVDPFAQSFGDADRFNLYFNMFLAFLIEIATTAGLPVMLLLSREISRIRYEINSPHSTHENSSPSDEENERNDSFSSFLNETYEPDTASFVFSSDMRIHYLQWCESRDEEKILSLTQIGQRMIALGFKRERRPVEDREGRFTGYLGLRLKLHERQV